MEKERIRQAFDKILLESSAADFFEGATDEDIHTFVIRKLGEETGDLVEKIHTGRSRNERVATGLSHLGPKGDPLSATAVGGRHGSPARVRQAGA